MQGKKGIVYFEVFAIFYTKLQFNNEDYAIPVKFS